MTRAYEHSHPWLTFGVNTQEFSHDIWMLLGAAQSKCRHIAGVPLSAESSDELYAVSLTRGAMGTTAIEGNTLTEEEVRAIVDNKSRIPASRQYLEDEVKNIINAYNYIADQQISGADDLVSVAEICKYNKLVLEGLPEEEDVVPGMIRKHAVAVNRYSAPPAEDCEYLLQRLCDLINGTFTLGPGWDYATSILKAIVAHIYIAWIHPFGNGNGRTARLLELKLCAAAGIPKPACHVLSNFYNKTRSEYYRELDKASRVCSITGFVLYALRGLVDMLDEQIEVIRNYQIKTTWENTVHRLVKGTSDAAERRRYLVLDLYGHDDGVVLSDVKTLSTRLALRYSQATSRTLTRDANALVRLKLVRVEGKKIFANVESILAWPAKRKV